MRAGDKTLAASLQEKGYRTAIFGKWHLGDNYPFCASDQGFAVPNETSSAETPFGRVGTATAGVRYQNEKPWRQQLPDHRGRLRRRPGRILDRYRSPVRSPPLLPFALPLPPNSPFNQHEVGRHRWASVGGLSGSDRVEDRFVFVVVGQCEVTIEDLAADCQ